MRNEIDQIRPIISYELAEFVYKIRSEKGYTWRALARSTCEKFNIPVVNLQNMGITLCLLSWEKLGKKYDYYKE